jgi:hypothetical protein
VENSVVEKNSGVLLGAIWELENTILDVALSALLDGTIVEDDVVDS